MAGLLDIFGSGGGETLGLLGMSPENIQQARDDAQAQALYGLAARLFQGGNTGASIAEGLQQGQKLYKSALQNQMQEQLQGVAVQDMLRKRKLEEQALARQAAIDTAVARAYQPAVQAQPAMFYGQETQLPIRDEEGNLMPFATEPIQGRAAGLDFQALAPALMASPEGRKTLSELVTAQKAMRPETFTLAEGAQQFERDPVTGAITAVASGAPKREPVPSSIAEYKLAQNQGFKGTFQDFLVAMNQSKAPKFAVDLKDPTAVANAQSKLINDWRGVVKDTGAMEVADRYKAAKGAVDEANAGNKTADGALIYAIGKIYDPSGAVQEGDKKTILGNRSIPQTVQAYAQKAFSGQELLPSEREGLLSMARKIVDSKRQNLDAQMVPYTSISRQLGGTGELLLNPLANVLAEIPSDLLAQAKAELARRRKPSAERP